MQQNDLPWLAQYLPRIRQQKRDNQLSHALLITGSTGVGKHHFAKLLGNYLLCDQHSDNSCGECKNCHWMALDHHPDFYSITPLEGKKSISIAQVRELIASLVQTPNHATRQVAIVHPAELMTTAAANALLKTLEEPCGDVVIMLVTDQPHRLPATIISRCQQIRIATPSQQESLSWLSDQLGDPNKAQQLLAINDDLPLLSLAQQDDDYQTLITEWQQLDPVALAEKWHSQNVSQVLLFLQRIMLDGLRILLALPARYFPQLPPTVWQQKTTEQVSGFLQSITEAKRLLNSSANPNPQLLLEKLLIEWSTA